MLTYFPDRHTVVSDNSHHGIQAVSKCLIILLNDLEVFNVLSGGWTVRTMWFTIGFSGQHCPLHSNSAGWLLLLEIGRHALVLKVVLGPYGPNQGCGKRNQHV